MTGSEPPARSLPELEPWPYSAADAHAWPPIEPGADPKAAAEELFKAKLEVRKQRTEDEIGRAKALLDADAAVEQAYYAAVLEVAKGSIDRTRASADTVQKAAAAIITLYTGALALAFSVAENPLPAKAVFAAVLLGLAILLATAFLAFLPDPEARDPGQAASDMLLGTTSGERLTNMFVIWTRKAALDRGRLLRASVVALAGAVALLPAPFVAIGDEPAVSKPADWPAATLAEGEDVELAKIRYAAQVAEIAEQRKQPIAEDETEWPWLAAFLAALIAIPIAYFVPRRRSA